VILTADKEAEAQTPTQAPDASTQNDTRGSLARTATATPLQLDMVGIGLGLAALVVIYVTFVK
jgi:hypothetical protein